MSEVLRFEVWGFIRLEARDEAKEVLCTLWPERRRMDIVRDVHRALRESATVMLAENVRYAELDTLRARAEHAFSSIDAYEDAAAGRPRRDVAYCEEHHVHYWNRFDACWLCRGLSDD